MSKSDTQSRQVLLKKNIIKGKLAEQIAKNDYRKRGYKIIPTTIGSDFIAKKIDSKSFHNSEYVEVKSGNAKPTKLQKRMMKKVRKEGKLYSLYRINDQYLRYYMIKLGMNSMFGEKSRVRGSTSCPSRGRFMWWDVESVILLIRISIDIVCG